jgi:uncharacterized protein Yka (UPF0111/DUF47 family)
MFSIQRLLGRDDEFWALLERSSQLSIVSIDALKQALLTSNPKLTLDVFVSARRETKILTDQLSELLVRALVVSLEREDIEALSEALYKIPKTVEKFAERYLLASDRVRGFDFTRQIVLMEEAVKSVYEMVQAFRSGAGVAEIKRLDARIQRLETEADEVVLHFLARLYEPDEPTLRGIILKDLFELNEKVVDRCRDFSGVLARVVMKNS